MDLHSGKTITLDFKTFDNNLSHTDADTLPAVVVYRNDTMFTVPTVFKFGNGAYHYTFTPNGVVGDIFTVGISATILGAFNTTSELAGVIAENLPTDQSIATQVELTLLNETDGTRFIHSLTEAIWGRVERTLTESPLTEAQVKEMVVESLTENNIAKREDLNSITVSSTMILSQDDNIEFIDDEADVADFSDEDCSC